MIASRSGRSRRVTLGADRGYDTADFVAELRALNVVAHLQAPNAALHDALDRGYYDRAVSLVQRLAGERVFPFFRRAGFYRRSLCRSAPLSCGAL